MTVAGLRRAAAGAGVAVLLSLLAASGASAQVAEREVQIPISAQAGVVEVDEALRRTLGLFPEVQGFLAARAFRTADGGYLLEISRRENGVLVRERRRVLEGEITELGASIVAALAQPGQPGIVSREARSSLVLAGTVAGLGYYGWAVPAALDIDSDRGRVALYLLTAGASFWIPYRVTRNLTVTSAHRDGVVWGATRGILYGYTLGDMVAGAQGGGRRVTDQFGNSYLVDDGNDDQVRHAFGLATSVAGSVVGYLAADGVGADHGRVAAWTTYADFGTLYGYGTSLVLGLYEGAQRCDFDVCSTSEVERTVRGHAASLALTGAALWAGRRIALREDYTVGDARALTSFGLLGAQAVLPLAYELADRDESEKLFVGSLIAGSAAGLALGNRFLRTQSLSDGDGLLVEAGHLAGGLLALGVTYLLDSGNRGDELVYLTTSSVGSIAGSLLTYMAVSERRGEGSGGDAPAASLPLPRLRLGGTREIDVSVSPLGLVAPFLGARGGLGDHGPVTGTKFARSTSVPVVQIRF